MKVKDLFDEYVTPEFDMVDLEDGCYRRFLRSYTIKDMIEKYPEYLDLDIINFLVYPGGMENDSVRFVVRVDM